MKTRYVEYQAEGVNRGGAEPTLLSDTVIDPPATPQETLETALDAAIATNNAYLALGIAATAADNAAQLRALTRQQNNILRHLRRRFDKVD